MASIKLPLNPYLSSVNTEEDMESPGEVEGPTCTDLIMASMQELQDQGKSVTLDSLKQCMAFEHSFDVLANQKLIQRSITTLRSKGILKKRGQWYHLVADPEEGKADGDSTNKSKEDNAVNSSQSIELTCKALILNALEELEGETVDFKKLTHRIAFGHGFNIIANQNLIKTTLKELRNKGAIIKNGISYKLFEKQRKMNMKAKGISSKNKMIGHMLKYPGSSCMSLILTSIKELDSLGKGVSFTKFTRHMAFEHSFSVQDNAHLIKAKLKTLLNNGLVIKKGFRYNIFKESKDTEARAKLAKSKLRNSRDSSSTTPSTKSMRELSNDIKELSPCAPRSHRGVCDRDHALRSRSNLGLAGLANSQIMERSFRPLQKKWRLSENDTTQTSEGKSYPQKVNKAKLKPSPQMAFPKKHVVITSLFGLLPPEMGLEIIKQLNLSDLDTLFTAFNDIRARYLPFLRSLSYTDLPEVPPRDQQPCRQTCLSKHGMYGVKWIFLQNRHVNRYLLRNKAVRSLTIKDGSGFDGTCTSKSIVNLTGNRSFHLWIDSLKIVNAELNISR